MPKVTFKVRKAGFQTETEDLTRLADVEVELSELNAKRFLLDPHQETLWDTCRFSGTNLSFDEWLTKYGNWNNEAKIFKVSGNPSK